MTAPGRSTPIEPLGERGQGGAGVEPVEEPSAAGAGRLAHAQDEADERRAHQDGHRHVEDQEPRQREIEQRRPQDDPGGGAGVPAEEPAARRVGQEDAAQPEQGGSGAHRPLARTEAFQAGGDRPVHERRLLEIRDPVQPRGRPVAACNHLPRDLRVPALVGIGERRAPEQEEIHGPEDQREAHDIAAPVHGPSILPAGGKPGCAAGSTNAWDGLMRGGKG